MAISDYKTILEKLSNGIAAPYLGVCGQEVSTAMEENGMPVGVYVATVSRMVRPTRPESRTVM